MTINENYSNILQCITRLLGSESTYDYQLEELGRSIIGKTFRGVFPSDLVPNLHKGDTCIINLDTSDKGGSHWVGCYCRSSKKNHELLVIYDSFGRDNKKIFKGRGQELEDAIETDRDAEQRITEDNCGQRSLAWCIYACQYGIDKAMLI